MAHVAVSLSGVLDTIWSVWLRPRLVVTFGENRIQARLHGKVLEYPDTLLSTFPTLAGTYI